MKDKNINLRIGIIELRELNHGVSDLCRIAMGTTDNVALFTKPAFLPQITAELSADAQRVTFHTCGNREPIFSFLRKVKTHCDAHLDMVLANTLTAASFAFFRPTCKFVGRVYNMNWWFADPWSRAANFRNLLHPRDIVYPSPIYNALTGPLLRRAIISNLDAVLVEYPPFVDYVKRDCGFEKPVYFLPIKTFQEQPNTGGSAKTVRFVIPGQIQAIRRDYDFVLDAVQQIPPHLYDKFSLGLLGRPRGRYGERIARRCRALAALGLRIDYSWGFVPPQEFDRQINEADILIAPLRRNFADHTVKETFTHTKGTGSFSDALRFGKPSIVPDFYNVADGLEECFVKYHNPTHLSDLMQAYAADTAAIHTLKTKALAALQILSLDACRRRFQEFTADLMQASQRA